MSEKRLTSRKRVMLPVRLKARGRVRWTQTQVEDLSPGGFRCLLSGEMWPIRTPVAFEIPFFPAEEPLAGMAHIAHLEQVRYSDQCSVGLKFDDVPTALRHRLHVFLKDARAGRRAPETTDYGEA